MQMQSNPYFSQPSKRRFGTQSAKRPQLVLFVRRQRLEQLDEARLRRHLAEELHQVRLRLVVALPLRRVVRAYDMSSAVLLGSADSRKVQTPTLSSRQRTKIDRVRVVLPVAVFAAGLLQLVQRGGFQLAPGTGGRVQFLDEDLDDFQVRGDNRKAVGLWEMSGWPDRESGDARCFALERVMMRLSSCWTMRSPLTVIWERRGSSKSYIFDRARTLQQLES